MEWGITGADDKGKESKQNENGGGGRLECKKGEWKKKQPGTMQIKRLKPINQSIDHVISAAEQKPPLAMS